MTTQRLCSITNCGKRYCAKGYCRTHYGIFITKRFRPLTVTSDLVGKRFGSLVVQKFVANSVYAAGWLCECDCGGARVLNTHQLMKAKVKSCGCLRRKQLLRHGRYGTRTYSSWQAMKSRCVNPKIRNYGNYGGRGITFCERWLKFENFFADMGECPESPAGLTLDRIDNDGNYEPGNCRWATKQEQVMNRRNTVSLEEYRAIKDMSEGGMKTKEIAEQLGLPKSTVGNRLNRARLLWAPSVDDRLTG